MRVTVGLRVIHLVEKSKMWESKRNFLIRARSRWAPARENKLVGRVCTCVGVCVWVGPFYTFGKRTLAQNTGVGLRRIHPRTCTLVPGDVWRVRGCVTPNFRREVKN